MNQVYFTLGRLINVTERMQVHGNHGWEPKTNENKGVFHSIGIDHGETVAVVEMDRGERKSLEFFLLTIFGLITKKVSNNA